MLLLKYMFDHRLLRNETCVPVFYRRNKTWVRVRVRMN